MVIVFFGTLDQVRFGINHTMELYFESFFVNVPVIALMDMLIFKDFDSELARFKFPKPGGYLIGLLLVINLVCAHFKHFKPNVRHLGISMIHGGLVILLVSGFLISAFQKEGRMWITEGGTANYSSSFHDNELVLIDKSGADSNHVTSIPAELLADGNRFELFNGITLEVVDYMPNASIFDIPPDQSIRPQVNRGHGLRLAATEKPKEYAQDTSNMVTAIVDVKHNGQPRGRWLVSNLFDNHPTFRPQVFSIGNRTYELSMRYTRTYYPFRIALDNFIHERYPGTNIPKAFKSEVRLIEPDIGQRPALIYMNNPLR